jgi:putative acetyltransferase
MSSEQSRALPIEIRAETDADHDAIAGVVARAFQSPAEARLVELIRASEHYVPEWSLVAVHDGRVVGHVMVSHVGLRDSDGDGNGAQARHVPSLSPLAVDPDVHGRGAGSALVRAVTARVDDAGEPLVVLEGAPAYYARFGFEPSAQYGVTITLPSWAPPEAAQLLRLTHYDPAVRGHVVYPAAFDEVTDH